jgi:hypothetical protein
LSFRITTRGSTKKTEAYLKMLADGDIFTKLEQYGQEGVNLLSAATPVRTGLTAASWRYKVTRQRGLYSITWYNSHLADGAPVAILLQYGHATGTGGLVQGRDYINPAIQPLFDKIAEDVAKAVRTA